MGKFCTSRSKLQKKISSYSSSRQKSSDCRIYQIRTKNNEKRRNLVFNSKMKEIAFGAFVWAKLQSYKWWPAVLCRPEDCDQQKARPGFVWVFWLGDHKISEVSFKYVCCFFAYFNEMFSQTTGKRNKSAIVETLKILETFSVQKDKVCDLISWASNGFSGLNRNGANCFFKNTNIPKKMLEYMKNISMEDIDIDKIISLSKRKVKSAKNIKGNKTIADKNREVIMQKISDKVLSIEDVTMQKIMDKVLSIEDVCICCFKASEVTFQHPLFKGGMCLSCKNTFEEIIFAYGNDGKNICCCICAKTGTLVLCDSQDCNRTFCENCLAKFVGAERKEKIIQASPWFCMLCSSSQYADSLLEIKNEWKTNILSFYKTNVLDGTSFSEYSQKFPLKVLSLFDGISTGKLVLDLLGIKVDKYYACEINEDAIHVSKCQHINNIIYLGDVCDLTENEIRKLCPIDLVIGGSPCSDLSLVNPFRKGLYDFTGTGILFFEYFRILNTVRRCNDGKHVFFLFENVAPLLEEDKSVITSFLMVEPVLIDAIYLSPQRRLRNYWGNIPGIKGLESYWNELQDENSINSNYVVESALKESLLSHLGRKAMVDKINTVTTHSDSLIQEQSTVMPVEMNGESDVVWVTELERIFGFPLHYTDTGNLSISTRRELLGRSWSVPVIKNILQPLKNFFLCNKDI